MLMDPYLLNLTDSLLRVFEVYFAKNVLALGNRFHIIVQFVRAFSQIIHCHELFLHILMTYLHRFHDTQLRVIKQSFFEIAHTTIYGIIKCNESYI